MKKSRLFLTTMLVLGTMLSNVFAQPAVDSFLIDPMYPLVDQPMAIYVNVNHFGLTTDNDSCSAWTAVYTSAGNWQHNPISDWTDESILLDMVNDSVFKLDITDLATFYNVTDPDESIFAIDFIARGHTAGGGLSGQTADLLFEVFSLDVADTAVQSTPALPNENEIAVVTFNINLAGGGLAATIEADPNDSVYIYTAANSNLSDWGHEVSPWGEVGSNDDLRLMRISDSIYRFYYDPSPRDFYDVTSPIEVLTQLNYVIRNGAGNSQTDNQYVPLDVQPYPVDMTQAVNGILTLPEYPTVDDNIVVLIDANTYVRGDGVTQLDPTSTFTAWSGLITSASNNTGDWLYQINGGGWGNIEGDSVQFARLNDSVQYWEVPSIADKYGINTSEEEVFRMMLIARDSAGGAVSNQSDDLAVEIYGGEPTTLYDVQPSVPDAYGAVAVTANISAEGGIADYSDSLYAHTGVFTNLGDWQHVIAEWSNNNDTNRCVQVNDSIYRFFVFPSVRDFYSVDDGEKVDTIVMILRTKTGTSQSTDIFIPVTDTTTPATGIEESTNDIISISLYPNPASETIHFDLGDIQSGTLYMYNISGQLIYTTELKAGMSTISVSEFASSSQIVYFQLVSKEGVARGQILIKK